MRLRLINEMPMRETPPDRVYVYHHSTSDAIIVYLADQQGVELESEPNGRVDAKLHAETGYYEVVNSTATHGWGPLLYEVAIELATVKGAALMSDRRSVDPAAKAVWDKFYSRADVKKEPIPGPWYEYNRRDDPHNPLFFSFRKQPERIARLKDAGKLLGIGAKPQPERVGV